MTAALLPLLLGWPAVSCDPLTGCLPAHLVHRCLCTNPALTLPLPLDLCLPSLPAATARSSWR